MTVSHTHEEPMADDTTEALTQSRRKLRETADTIVRLLSEDLASYPERELQRRFVHSDASDRLTDAQLVELRKDAKRTGQAFVGELQLVLAHDEPWLALANSVEPLPEQRKNLREVAAVWQAVSAIDPQIEALAATWHLGADDRTPPGYQPPARFIGRDHLPTLVEHYFRHVVELRRLGQHAAHRTAEAQKQARAARWDAAAGG